MSFPAPPTIFLRRIGIEIGIGIGIGIKIGIWIKIRMHNMPLESRSSIKFVKRESYFAESLLSCLWPFVM